MKRMKRELPRGQRMYVASYTEHNKGKQKFREGVVVATNGTEAREKVEANLTGYGVVYSRLHLAKLYYQFLVA